MTFGSLFAGIGGFDLGFERAGMTCKWQVEIDPYCQRVLAKHWPQVRRHDDVKTFPPTDAEDWRVDVICGGFPCQDISVAGKGAGIDGKRSGLWADYARIVRDIRPRFVVVENVPALLVRGIDRVLGELAACGYSVEWDCLPAVVFGAPHRRDRLFLVAHASGTRAWGICRTDRGQRREQADASEPETLRPPHRAASSGRTEAGGCIVPDAESIGRRARRPGRALGTRSGKEDAATVADSASVGCERRPTSEDRLDESHGKAARREEAFCTFGVRPEPDREQWATEPAVGRVANGVPNRVDRLRGLGNAVVPQVAEWIGRRIMDSELINTNLRSV